MGLVLPDWRLEHPWAFHPGRKPLIPVKANPNHPIGKNLKIAILPNVGTMRDIVSGDIAQSVGNATVTGQKNAEYDGAGDKHQFGFVTPPFAEITVMARVKRHAAGANNDMGVYSDKYVSNWTSNGISLNLRASSSGLLFNVGSALSYVDDTSVAINNWMHVCGTWAGGQPKLFLNGVEKARDGGGSTISYTASTGGNARTGTYYDEEARWTLDGEIEYVYVFNRALPASLIRRVILHPYCSGPVPMLIPA